MPLEVEFAPPARFRVRASGEVTLDQIRVLYAEIMAHPNLSGGVDSLVECVQMDAVPSTSELRVAARELRAVLDRGMGAVGVVSSDPYVYGVARMFGVFAEAFGATVGSFRDTPAAERWLASRRPSVANAPET